MGPMRNTALDATIEDKIYQISIVCPEKKEKGDQNVFLQYLLQNSGDSDEIWYTVFQINLLQINVNVSHLTRIMSLHYLVKLEMLIGHVLPLSCYRKKLQNLSHLNCGLQIRYI